MCWMLLKSWQWQLFLRVRINEATGKLSQYQIDKAKVWFSVDSDLTHLKVYSGASESFRISLGTKADCGLDGSKVYPLQVDKVMLSKSSQGSFICPPHPTHLILPTFIIPAGQTQPISRLVISLRFPCHCSHPFHMSTCSIPSFSRSLLPVPPARTPPNRPLPHSPRFLGGLNFSLLPRKINIGRQPERSFTGVLQHSLVLW